MRFSLAHKLATYLMVLAAFSSLVASPDLGWTAKGLALLGIMLSFFFEPDRHGGPRWTMAWNTATVLFLAYLLVSVFHDGEVVAAGISFLLFVLVNKLFNRASSKDYRQAYVISFLLLVAATTLNTNLSYALSFLLYVVFMVWALTLFHLRREMEENYLLRHGQGGQSEKVEVDRILNSRRIVGLPFFLGTSLVSLGVLLLSSAIFMGFPRVGFGLFLGQRRGGLTMVGFSERVELGHHGVIRDNPQVVMRVMFPGGRPPVGLYFRGSLYDHYENGVWSHGSDLQGRPLPVIPQDDMYIVNHAPGLPFPLRPSYVQRHLLRHEIYLEPMDSTLVFAIDRPVGLVVPRPVVGGKRFFVPAQGPLGEIRASRRRTAGVRYIAYSHIAVPPPEVLRQARPDESPRWKRFRQRPANLPRRVGDLARRLTRDRRTLYDKVIAIRDYLRRTYPYTLELRHQPGREPVDEFLFETREGHCEYFASAMALMLREVGIHSRQVNGFAGGQWNEYGGYLAVRQGDAHAWVEVLFPNVGWVAFDPTPSGSQEAANLVSGRVGQFLDALRLRWFRYVVEYDLDKQVGLARRVVSAFRPRGPDRTGLFARYRPILIVLLSGVAVGLLGLALRRLWPRVRRRLGMGPQNAEHTHPAGLWYRRLLTLLARAGLHRAAGQTPLEFATQLSERGAVASASVLRFTRLYYRVRFEGEPEDPAAIRELARLFDEVRHALKEAQRAPQAPRPEG